MIISGENFRSLAERDEISFSAKMSISNTSGNVELGFSGDSEGLRFQMSGSKMFDPEGRCFNSYLKDGVFTLSGNLETGVYDYYVDNKVNCSNGVKNNFKINKFFINSSDSEVDLDLKVYSTGQDYSLTHYNPHINNDFVKLDLSNNQPEKFTIFTGEVMGYGVNHSFLLDTDVPTGKYDGTYVQDYKYYVGSGDLDECNGRFAVTPEYPSGVYHYHIADSWPYVMSCFKGRSVTQVPIITENTSGTNPISDAPSPWLTGEFFDRQTQPIQRDNVRHYTKGATVEYSDDYAYIRSKGIPNHFYGPFVGNPNTVSQQDHIFKIPLVPVENTIPEPIPMHEIGVAINGVPIDLLSNEYYKNRKRWRLAVHPVDWESTTAPFARQGYYPLYSTSGDAKNASPTPNVARPGETTTGYHSHVLDETTYYMPNGLIMGSTQFHGNYGFGLDKHNAHVQPNGAYHYHSSPSGIVADYDFTTPSISVSTVPSKYPAFTGAGFTKYSSAFGVNVFATSGVSDAKILHTANVIAEYLDNDLDGVPDNIDVVNSLVSNEASMILTSGTLGSYGMDYEKEGVSGINFSKLSGYNAIQDLRGTEINHTGSGVFDATIEETLHLLTDYGWSEVYPPVFGTLSGSKVANYMDSGRGGHFEWCARRRMPDGTISDGTINGPGQSCLEWGAVYNYNTFTKGKAIGSYPSGSWFHYYDKSCDYSCQVSEYLYWGITTVLGAQTGRYSEVYDEWDHVTPTGFKSGDPNFYNLIVDNQYKLPTGHLPTGTYSPSASTTTYGNTGHSPILGYAFDGYPIYGPYGYSNTGVSGEVKVMKSSYLPKNINREAPYPKVVEQYNDLYLPDGVDLVSSGDVQAAESLDLTVSLYTNCGDFQHVIPLGAGELNSKQGAQGGSTSNSNTY